MGLIWFGLPFIGARVIEYVSVSGRRGKTSIGLGVAAVVCVQEYFTSGLVFKIWTGQTVFSLNLQTRAVLFLAVFTYQAAAVYAALVPAPLTNNDSKHTSKNEPGSSMKSLEISME